MVLAQPSSFSTSGIETYYARVSFLDSATGKRTRSGLSLQTSGFLFSTGDHVTYVSAGNGDITVFNVIDPNYFESVVFQRQDYTLLEPRAAAIDPAGNVYFLTYSGGRSEAKPTLCRAQVPSGGECYFLPALIGPNSDDKLELNGLVALDNGELFVHSGFDLVHVTYPQQ